MYRKESIFCGFFQPREYIGECGLIETY